MKKFIFIAFAVLIGAIIILSNFLKKEKAENKRLNGNQKSLLEGVETYRFRDSLSAISVERLLLTKKEYERNFEDQKKIIDDLKIKVKRLQSVSETGTVIKYDIKTQIRDSIVMRDSLTVLKCIELHTPYLDVSGCIEDETFSGSIITRDTLFQVIHRVPYRFWFIKWGTKAIRQEIVSKNPNSRISYNKYIEIN